MSTPQLTLSRTFRDLTAAHLWDLMWRPDQQRRWLGDDAVGSPTPRTRISIGDAAGGWRSGWILSVRPQSRWVGELGPASTWPAARTLVVMRLRPQDGGAVELEISERGLPDDRTLQQAQQFWTAALGRLGELARAVRARREAPRQAVIIIHGIGEQRPGRTLRDFMASGVVPTSPESTWVKPDGISGSFELRSATVAATRGQVTPRTDVYEFYWAHLIRDTTLGQVTGWARHLLLRHGIPRPLRPAIYLLRLIALLALAAVLIQLIWHLPWLSAGGLLVVVGGLLWRLAGRKIALDTVGDAARYLSPDPGNVAHRQEIRQAGVDLIEKLHRQGQHDRIVVLGHSLGSVIAYDIVTFAWIRLRAKHDSPQHPTFSATRSVERAITKDTDLESAQDLQHDAWLEQRRNTQPWLITDLVTVGSPLTYADFLMADSSAGLAQAQADRVLPTCPPATEVERRSTHRRCSYESAYRNVLGDGDRLTFTVFHHAAPFAVTRWTNLYFTVGRLGASGDLVGGPVAPQLGSWIRDVAMPSPVKGFAHTHYWRPSDKSNAHIAALQQALRLESGAELMALAQDVAPALLLDRARESLPDGPGPKG